MSVIDFHAHILPGIDDGSRNREMSEEMLKRSAEQGIHTIIATPHFYASRATLKGFLQKRAAAYEHIKDLAERYGVRVPLGAEVAFFSGMHNAEGLEELTIGDTSLLLLEMPFRAWDGGDLQEVEKLIDRGVRPVIAHVERFYPYQKDKRVMEELYSLPVLVQVNAEALLSWSTRRLALKLFREGVAHLLGSDCHNTSSRPPNLAAGRKIIEKKLGAQYLPQIDRLGEEALEV